MPEADLWAAVFRLAMQDACETERFATRSNGNGSAPTQRDALEAWEFLTAGGEWGAYRDWLAGMNGVNAGIIREEAIKRGPSRAIRAARLGREMAEPVQPRKRRVRPPQPTAEIQARNAAIFADYAAGVGINAMAEKYDLLAATINMLAAKHGVKRPPGYLAAIGRAAALVMTKTDRNAVIWARSLEGESNVEIAQALRVTRRTVEGVLTRMRKQAGSAVDDRGISRAAGGGGVGSFHGQTMQDNGR